MDSRWDLIIGVAPHRGLSIPLNGFSAEVELQDHPPKLCFQFHWMDSKSIVTTASGSSQGGFQFHWMDSDSVIKCARLWDREIHLSISLNGFAESRDLFRMKFLATFNSIEWIPGLSVGWRPPPAILPFNSIEWILYEFIPKSSKEDMVLSFNSIEWIRA